MCSKIYKDYKIYKEIKDYFYGIFGYCGINKGYISKIEDLKEIVNNSKNDVDYLLNTEFNEDSYETLFANLSFTVEGYKVYDNEIFEIYFNHINNLQYKPTNSKEMLESVVLLIVNEVEKEFDYEEIMEFIKEKREELVKEYAKFGIEI